MKRPHSITAAEHRKFTKVTIDRPLDQRRTNEDANQRGHGHMSLTNTMLAPAFDVNTEMEK